MENEILFRRRRKLLLKNGAQCGTEYKDSKNERYLATILKNLEAYGYTVSDGMYHILSGYSRDELLEFYREVKGLILHECGGDYQYHPMYANFPEEVMEKSDAELYLNAFLHYLTNGCLFPVSDAKERLPFIDETKYQVLDVATFDDILDIMWNLMSAKTSLSQMDKDDLAWYFSEFTPSIQNMPEEIPHRENAAYICALYLKYNPLPSAQVVSRYMTTATDVLRLVAAISGGDVSLAEPTRFISLPRKFRRMLLSVLEHISNLEEDMLRYPERWIRLGESLHPGDYPFYRNVNTAFHKLRNHIKIQTFHGKLQANLDSGNYAAALSMLKTRAGEFARKLDYLLRTVENPNTVVNAFAQVAQNVSTPVLWQVKNHFDHRTEPSAYRVFFPKGNLAKSHLEENNLPPLNAVLCQNISSICEHTLLEVYQKRPFIGKVYLEDELKHYFVPFSQRSASNAMRTVVRGSKLPLKPDAHTIRAFIHWHNMNDAKSDDIWDDGRVDIDLSAVLYNENWKYMEHISYTNLRSGYYHACHSGDIVTAPDGACEFIDIDLDSLTKYGARYVVFTVNSFTRQPFAKIPECFMGWMEREEPNSGEVFEAASVRNRIDLTAAAQISIPMILDAKERRIIWADMALKNDPRFNVNIENNQGGIVATCMALTVMQKPTVYDLISVNIHARGIHTDSPADADIVFSVEKPEDMQENTMWVSPFQTDTLMSEFL